MKLIRIILPLLFLCVSFNVLAAEMTVINHATKKDQWFDVVAFGAPTEYMNVGALGGTHSAKNSIQLADDRYGKYRITKIKYCIGTFDECVKNGNLTHFSDCTLNDPTSQPINEINAKVIVKLNRWTGCYAYIVK